MTKIARVFPQFSESRKCFGSLLVAAVLLAALPAKAEPAAGVLGKWRNSDADAEIAIGHCGPALCGTIVWMQQERLDGANPDARLRRRSLLGADRSIP